MSSTFSQTMNKEIFVINFVADWCPVCKAHGARYEAEIIHKYGMEEDVKFLERNMTNPQTLQESDAELEKLGLLPALKEARYTGVLYLVDGKSKKLISEVSVSQPSSTIMQYIDDAKTGQTLISKSDDPKVYYLAIQYLKPGGMDKLNEFNQKAMPILTKYGFKAEGAMQPFHVLPGIGGNQMEAPDQIVIFSAPDENALLKLVMDTDYQAILPLRAEALRELTFIATKKLF